MANPSQQEEFPLVVKKLTRKTKQQPIKKWGVESQHAIDARERQLAQPITDSCGICGVSVRRSAKLGIDWFKRHQETPQHKAAVAALTRKGSS